ncbi:SRPBCC domain-containing protein [Jiangella mangrovi]|uniref:Uncharacterized protein YndB with AHSA1/START domain n=1 Tax=Jiangella mangrovi TaxID=1524084 RepID=A0A7W9LK24_9ACTN|nr:SRPBCC domain-containing protein [Jiangella mangrovi]MBB5786730.1 uncharacterized protein YndB with AHSA1/START domain [Jiangella mangrovi]
MTIERDIEVDAPPDVVFDVLSRSEHLWEWWFGDAGAGPVAFTVVAADPPNRFAFRWRAGGPGPAPGRPDPLVTFDLVPAPAGTRLHLTVATGEDQDSAMR